MIFIVIISLMAISFVLGAAAFLAYTKIASIKSKKITSKYLECQESTEMIRNEMQLVTNPAEEQKMQKLLSIIIPYYNEEKRIIGMLQDCTNAILQMQQTSILMNESDVEIVLVDDGSSDNTFTVLMELITEKKRFNFRIVKHNKNMGKGAAIASGIFVSRGDFVVFADADGATSFSVITSFMEKAIKLNKSEEMFVIFGERKAVDRTILRFAFSKIFEYSKKIILGIRVADPQCGFKMFSRKAAIAIFSNIHLHRWGFDVEMFKLCHMLKIQYFALPVQWREVTGSKVKLLRDPFMMLGEIFLLKIGYDFKLWSIK